MNLVYLILSIIVIGGILLTRFLFNRRRKKIVELISVLETNRKETEKTLKEVRDHASETASQKKAMLVREGENLKQNLKSMQAALEATGKSARGNSMLLSNISFTLRTNLNDILGFSYLLGNDFAKEEDTELYEYTENIRKSGETLTHLLNNVIDISRIEANTFDLIKQNCDLTALMNELKNEYEPVAKQKGLQLFFQGEAVPVFSTDVEALKHILSNMLDNAIKYTGNGFVKIIQKPEKEQVIISVKDTGAGIDKAYRDEIFEPFHRQSLGYSKTAYQGAGLGLPLVKQMVTLMGGSVGMESEKASGTTVTIRIPRIKPIPGGATPEKTQDLTTKKKKRNVQLKHSLNKVLIMDNDHLNNMLIRKMLPGIPRLFFAMTEKELDTIIQDSGKTGEPFDIVIMNIDFAKEKDGISLMEDLQKNYAVFRRTPFVAMSDILDIAQREKMLKAGFKTYMDKPISKEKLFSIMNIAVE